MATEPVKNHKENKTLRQLYTDRVGENSERRGFVRVVCIDDDVPVSMNKKFDNYTMVPRAKTEGGCLHAPNEAHTRYGEGVLRRQVRLNEAGEWEVLGQIENFRPDAAAQKLEPRTPRMSGQELRLAARLAQMEHLCQQKVANVLGDAGTKKDYELRLPYDIHKDFKDGMKGYATAYGRNDRIELRHKQTGLCEHVDIKDIQ